MDTDRERDISLVEVQQENKELVEAFYREKMGKRGQHANQEPGEAEADISPEAPGEAIAGLA